MKVNRETREAVYRLISKRSNVDKDEIVDLLGERLPRPLLRDLYVLYEQELARTAARLLSTYRDEHGKRSIFSTTQGHFTNVDISEDVPDLQAVEEQLRRKVTGLASSIVKVRRRKQIVAGQLTLEEAAELYRRKEHGTRDSYQ